MHGIMGFYSYIFSITKFSFLEKILHKILSNESFIYNLILILHFFFLVLEKFDKFSENLKFSRLEYIVLITEIV